MKNALCNDLVMNILVVEDEAIARNKIEKAITNIKEFDTYVHTAHNYRDALEISKKYLIDLFILDIILLDENGIAPEISKLLKKNGKLELPVGNGLELAVKLREEYPYNPIIFETDISNEQIELLIMRKVEIVKFITKPYETQEMTELVKNQLIYVEMTNPHEKMLDIVRATEGYQLFIKDVIYIESLGNSRDGIRVVLFDDDTREIREEIIEWYSLKEIMHRLRHKNALIQCHRQFIINPQYRLHYRNDCIDMKFINKKIPVGGKYRQNL